MKKITLLLLLVFFAAGTTFAQCIVTTPYLTVNSNNSGNVQTISTCSYGGDYNTVNALIIGANYRFTSAAGYVTITDTSNNVLGFGPTPVTINNISVASIRLHNTTSAAPACGTDTSCHTTTIQRLIPPPANDLCVNAINIGSDGTIAGTTLGATVDSAGTCNGVTNTVAGVWYSFTDVTGVGSTVTINTCSAIGYDTKLSVYTGSCGAFTCVTANDDAGAACGISSVRSEVTFTTDGSSTYYVLVHGFSTTGNFELNVSGLPTLGDPPVIACPSNITANNAPGQCSAVVNFTGVAFDTEDGNISGDIVATPPSGSDFPVGDTTVTLSVTDSDGNTSTCNFIVTVIDNELPVAVCQDITVELDPVTGVANITAADVDNGSSDNCGIASMTLDVSSFDCSMTGANTVVMTVTDDSGNISTCTSTVTVEDNTAPEIFCVGGFGTFTESEDFEAGLPSGWSTVVNTGTCDWINSGDMPTGDDFPTLAMLFDDDDCGLGAPASNVTLLSAVYDLTGASNVSLGYDVAFQESGTQTFTVEVFDGTAWQQIALYEDDLDPDIQTETIDASAYANANFQVRWTYDDNGGEWGWGAGVDNFLLSYDASSGGGLDVFLDANGMASIDPMDLLVNVNEACGYTITAGGVGGGTMGSLSTLFTSNNGGSPGWAVMYDLTVGPNDIEVTDIDVNIDGTSTFNLDMYTLVGTYVGNETNAAAWGSPAASGTGTGLGIDQPSNAVLSTPVVLSANTTYGIAIVTDSGQNYTNGDGSNQNFSNADLSLSLGTAVAGLFTGSVFSPRVWNGTINYTTTGGSGLDFTCADLGENQVEVTVTDNSGNESTCIAIVNVIDLIAPVITCGPPVITETEEVDFEGSSIPNGWTTQINAGSQDWTFGSGDMPTGTDFPSNAAIFDDDAAGNGAVNNATLISPVYDLSGASTASLSFDYAMQEFLGDGTLTVEVYDGAAWQEILFVDVSTNPTNTGAIDLAAYLNANFQVRYTYDDEGGWGWGAGVDNFELTYSIVPTSNIVEIELGPDGTTSVDPYSLVSNIDEACGISTIAVDVPTVSCADIGGTFMITVFVSDTSGNIASCIAEVSVVDRLAPELTCPADQTVDPGAGNLFYILPDYFATGEATADDNCTDPVTITTQDPAPGTALPDGTYTITMTATDEYGNTATCDFELIVETVLGVDTNSLDAGLALYPNPASSVVNLVNKTNISLEKMMIYDINGKLVNQTDLRTMQGERAVDVSSLASGVYMVQIIGDNASTVKRLIKE